MPGLIKCSWNDVRMDMMGVCPKLKEIIDDLSPPDHYSLYVAEYPYGALIVDEGVFHVMNQDNQLVPLHDHSINNDIKEDLGYAGVMPVGLIAENSIEVFFLNGHRPIPSAFYQKGAMVSLWGVFGENSYQTSSLWNISSGARTICMLPKITDKACNENLRRKYHLKQALTHYSLSNHWAIFESIANHANFSQNHWRSRVIYFSKEWFSHAQDKNWAQFYQFLLTKALHDPVCKSNQFILDLVFYLAQKSKNLKPNPYLADTVRHLIQIGIGGMPGLKPAIDDIAAPITGLQETYVEDYGLKKLPVIMHSHHFSLAERVPVYYSLQLPTTAAFSSRSSKIYSKMSDMRDLKELLNIFLDEIAKKRLGVEQSQLANLAKEVVYSFYHSEEDQQGEIVSSSEIALVDPNFYKTPFKTENLAFPDFAPFFRGCISIARKTI